LKSRIIDIARLAQVSTGTVDRVIHNRGEVSEKTRNKVLEIIKELDYQPDILARSLATKKQYHFFVIIPVSANENDFWYAPLKGIEKALDELSHYGIRISHFFFNHFDKEDFINVAARALTEKPDGLLFAPVFEKESRTFMRQLEQLNIPIVLINSSLEEKSSASFIGQDSIQSGYLAGKLLTYGKEESGNILIVNISARKDNYYHILRRERGFRKYFSENKLDNYGISTIEAMQSTSEDLKNKLNKEFAANRLTGVFVTNSRVHQLARYLEENDIHNVRLIGYDLLPESVRYLRKGKIDFLISQRPEEQGYMGILSLFNNVFLKKPVEVEQYLPIDIITKENIDYYKFR
jgi:LacI family transcriptional regulator